MKKPDKDSPRRMSEQTKGRLKNAAASAAGGIFIGAVSPLFMSMTKANEESSDTTNHKETLSHPELVDDEVTVATGVSDDMSFGEAFAAARAEVGAGGVFEWHGGLYGTYYADEWNHMSSTEKAEYGNHFAWNKIDRSGSDISHHSISHTRENLSNEESHHATQGRVKPVNLENFEEEEDDIDIVSVTHDDLPEDEIEILGIMHDDPSEPLLAHNPTDDVITIVNVHEDPVFTYQENPGSSDEIPEEPMPVPEPGINEFPLDEVEFIDNGPDFMV